MKNKRMENLNLVRGTDYRIPPFPVYFDGIVSVEKCI